MSEEINVATRKVHEAISTYLDEDEIAIAWMLTIDVAGQEGVRYLAHRAGGGADGTDAPMTWTTLGMLEASVGVVKRQLAGMEFGVGDDDEED